MFSKHLRCLLGLILLAALAAPARGDGYNPLSEPLAVGEFTLTAQDGQTVTLDDLRGKVWIAHFFYPTCQGPCTKTVPTMRLVHEAFAGKPDVVLVSIALTADPPSLLEHFARDQGAGPGWLFLTSAGGSDELLQIVQTKFFQTALRKKDARPGDEIDHSTSLVLVDREGRMRGYVDGRDAQVVPELVSAARRLAAQRYWLPAQNAVLNSCSAALLVVGWLAIKLRRERLHIACMTLALVTSAVFLAGYLYFHFAVQAGQPTRFRGPEHVQLVYLGILVSHTLLAMVVAPLALYVAWQGWRDHRPRHVRVARWTLPIWLYVSVTGVIVYWMLYQVYPPY
jgi:protein SCO1/2/putative membrane protein